MNEGLSQGQYYSYEDWVGLDIEGLSELIDGQIFMMADPTSRHQEVQMALTGQLWTFLRNKPCQLYTAPFGVRLSPFKDTAYEPDILVLCDPSKRRTRGCVGAPDMIIEILSPSTAKRDKLIKYNDYMQAGVKEYWIVDPEHYYMDAYRLIDGQYIQHTYYGNDIAPVQVLQGCEIDLSLVFRNAFE